MNNKSYKSADDFAKDFGLSEVEIALIKEKKKLIEKLTAKRDKMKLSQAAVAKLIGSNQSLQEWNLDKSAKSAWTF